VGSDDNRSVEIPPIAIAFVAYFDLIWATSTVLGRLSLTILHYSEKGEDPKRQMRSPMCRYMYLKACKKHAEMSCSHETQTGVLTPTLRRQMGTLQTGTLNTCMDGSDHSVIAALLVLLFLIAITCTERAVCMWQRLDDMSSAPTLKNVRRIRVNCEGESSSLARHIRRDCSTLLSQLPTSALAFAVEI
jgi:hypothetical protein